MTSERIKEIQMTTAYPESVSVMSALNQVWNECEQEKANRMYSEEDMNKYGEYCASHVLKSQIGHPYLSVTEWFEQFKKK